MYTMQLVVTFPLYKSKGRFVSMLNRDPGFKSVLTSSPGNAPQQIRWGSLGTVFSEPPWEQEARTAEASRAPAQRVSDSLLLFLICPFTPSLYVQRHVLTPPRYGLLLPVC